MPLEDLTLAQFTQSLGAKSPTPGGGAVAPMVASIAAALATMVVNYSLGKKRLADHDALHREALDTLDDLGGRAAELADADARAYERLSALMKLDDADPARLAEWSDAVEAAIDAPRRSLDLGLTLLTLIQRLAGATNRMLASDLAIAAILSDAVVHAGAWNVRVNLSLLEDASRATEIESFVASRTEQATALRHAIESQCANRS